MKIKIGNGKKVGLNSLLTKQKKEEGKIIYQGESRKKADVHKLTLQKDISSNNEVQNDVTAKIKINSELLIILKKVNNIKMKRRKILTRNNLKYYNFSTPLKEKEKEEESEGCITVIENDCENDYSLICESLNLFNS